jgi:hypothetical protein
MAADESEMLPLWLDYYGRQLGRGNLYVLDDNSSDGSTDGLDCSVIRLPPAPWKRKWSKARRGIVNGLSRALLEVYDAVVFVDTDEFLVPDPAKYDGLRDYITRRSDLDVMAGLGLDLLHDPDHEPPIDPSRRVLTQRSLVKVEPGMSKPSIKRIPEPWLAGGHGIRAEFGVDPDLLLIHLKYYDAGHLRRVAERRHAAHVVDGRGSRASAWVLDGDALDSRLRSWVAESAMELDTRSLALPEPEWVSEKESYRMFGGLETLDTGDLLRLPKRFSAVEL